MVYQYDTIPAMFDPTILTAALGSLKIVIDLVKNANDAQLALKVSSEVVNIQARLLTVQQQAIEIQAENLRLTEENSRLRKAMDVDERLRVEGGMYWLSREGNQDDGPFCTACWDSRSKLVRIQPARVMGIDNGQTCPVCGTQFLEG